MSSASDAPKGTFERLRKKRRFAVKRTGKRAIYALGHIMSRQSLVGDTPFLDKNHFPFLKPFEAEWEVIRSEVLEILKHREAVPGFEEVSRDQKKIAKGKNWRTFVLYGFGEKMEKNCRQAPRTTELLERIPELQTAWFSILAPGYHIPAHSGVSKGILRAHLGLIIPREREKCRIRVDQEIRPWKAGEIFVFDDTYEHEVWNDTDEERVVLLFDFDRPMRFWGRAINSTFLRLMKLTAFYQEPKRNMQTFEERFEAATRRADANLEKLSEPPA
ncbi:MAG: aspartyl/asparaginyl beta-hydroxylase domain-containing protein [Parvibaculaceae bacterium]